METLCIFLRLARRSRIVEGIVLALLVHYTFLSTSQLGASNVGERATRIAFVLAFCAIFFKKSIVRKAAKALWAKVRDRAAQADTKDTTPATAGEDTPEVDDAVSVEVLEEMFEASTEAETPAPAAEASTEEASAPRNGEAPEGRATIMVVPFNVKDSQERMSLN